MSLYSLVFEDIKLEKKVAEKAAKDLNLPSGVRYQAKSHADELDSAEAGRRRSLPAEPSDEFRPDLHGLIKQARDARDEKKRAQQTRKREAKEARKQAELDRQISELPKFTASHQAHADNLVSHASNYYDAARKMAEAKAHMKAISRAAPGHKDLGKWHKALSVAGGARADARRALLAGMNSAGIHPAHIERVLQPDLHGVHAGSRLHVNAVADLLGGKPKGKRGYEFDGSDEGHNHFMLWARQHHAHREPREHDKRVILDKGNLAPGYGLPPKRDIEGFYRALGTGSSASSRDDIARRYAAERQKQIASDSNMLGHLLRKRRMKPIGKYPGLYEHRYWGGPDHGVMRVYTDIKGRFLHHGGKSTQSHDINVAGEKLKAMLEADRRQQAEAIGYRTMAILESRFVSSSLSWILLGR